MPSRSRPTLADITVVFAHLSDRVSAENGPDLDPIVTVSLQRALQELRRFIPGLETPPDPHAARFFAAGARAALESGLNHDALARSLRGLSFAPHDPNLFYLAACACFELGCVRDAVDLLLHALWIHPGHPEAARDLECISALRSDASDDEIAAGAPFRDDADPLEEWEPAADQQSLRFESLDDISREDIDALLSALDAESPAADLDRDEQADEDDESEDREAA